MREQIKGENIISYLQYIDRILTKEICEKLLLEWNICEMAGTDNSHWQFKVRFVY